MSEGKPPSSDGLRIDNANPMSTEMDEFKQMKDVSHVERVLSPEDGLGKDDMDYSRVDKEVQEYVARGRVEVDEATNRRLRRMIDRRVLIIMVFTYFMQALDKGTMSFASIMGIIKDTGMKGSEVSLSQTIGETMTK